MCPEHYLLIGVAVAAIIALALHARAAREHLGHGGHGGHRGRGRGPRGRGHGIRGLGTVVVPTSWEDGIGWAHSKDCRACDVFDPDYLTGECRSCGWRFAWPYSE